jgi:hypothetical protein
MNAYESYGEQVSKKELNWMHNAWSKLIIPEKSRKTMDFHFFGQTNIMDNLGVLGMALDHFSRLLFIG